jgi:hypothetical protein
MVSTSENSFEQKSGVSAIKPEIMEFFRDINPNVSSNEVATLLKIIEPSSQPNPILGTLVNLLYLEDGNNLAEIVIQEDDTGNKYTLSAESDLIENSNAIQIDNLKDFQFRLQDTFNHDSLISLFYENNSIKSLEIIKREQNTTVVEFRRQTNGPSPLNRLNSN